MPSMEAGIAVEMSTVAVTSYSTVRPDFSRGQL